MNVAATAIIGDNVVLPENSTIEDFVVIGIAGSGSIPSFGEGSVIRSGSLIYSGVVAGAALQTGHHVVIRSGTTIGDYVVVGTHSILDGDVQIGNNVSIQSNVYIPPGSVIGDQSFLGPCCVLTNDRTMGSYVRGIVTRGEQLPGPVIGRAVRIGANSTILPGVTIGDEAVVGAGAVVTKDVAPRSIVIGVPARHVSQVPEEQLYPSNRRSL